MRGCTSPTENIEGSVVKSIIFHGGKATMANIKSAKKRILTSAKKAARNKAVKSEIKTEIKKVRAAIESGDKAAAGAALSAAASTIGSAASKGVLHKNTAARKVSRLADAVNKIEG